MRSRTTTILIVSLVLVAFAGATGVSKNPFRSIGLRVVLPWKGLPLLVGAEATVDLRFGRGAMSFFLTGEGQVLFAISADALVSAPTNPLSIYVRATTGLFYFDPSAYAPTPLIGGGVYYEVGALEPILVGFAAELLYPLAFPFPMISTSLGWALP